MKHTITERTLAFAGIFQATQLVQQVAQTGRPDNSAFETSIASLFKLNADTTEDVFGGSSGVRLGLESIIEHLSRQRNAADMMTARYIISLLSLESRLSKSPAALAKITQGIEQARQQVELYGLTHANVIANLANLYLENISPLGPRIIVSGEQGLLQVADNANRVRAILLAGIRAAVLWRQVGGTRWQLLFNRAAILIEAKTLLARMN